ncbi:beta-galactosidase [Micromonosporaceae bacterium Da 78-11]
MAIILDWESLWAVDQPDHPAQIDYLAHVRGWHTALHTANIQTDLVRAQGPFDGYRLIIAPSLYLLRDATALTRFAADGGHLLVTAFSDVVDEHDRFLPGGFTQRLGPTPGLQVTEFAGVTAGEATVTWGPATFAGEALAEVLRLDGADVLGAFADGSPALTRHRSGAGMAYYVATLPDAAGRNALVHHLTAEAGVTPVLAGLPPRVEACARGNLITVINHNPVPAQLDDGVLEPYGYRFGFPSQISGGGNL